MPEIAANTPGTGKRARAVVVRNVRRVHFIRECASSFRHFIRLRALRLAVETPPKGNDRAASGQGVGS